MFFYFVSSLISFCLISFHIFLVHIDHLGRRQVAIESSLVLLSVQFPYSDTIATFVSSQRQQLLKVIIDLINLSIPDWNPGGVSRSALGSRERLCMQFFLHVTHSHNVQPALSFHFVSPLFIDSDWHKVLFCFPFYFCLPLFC